MRGVGSAHAGEGERDRLQRRFDIGGQVGARAVETLKFAGDSRAGWAETLSSTMVFTHLVLALPLLFRPAQIAGRPFLI
jgi:hypothetical protein